MTRLLIALVLMFYGGAAALADPHPLGKGNHRLNGSVQPVTQDGVTTFVIRSGECSNRKYGDGRGESDCSNGNVRSLLTGTNVSVGETVTYEFEVRADPLTYEGFVNSHAAGFLYRLQDSRLRIASWEGNHLHNFIYILHLDARRGIRFLDTTCAGPEEIGNWMRFKMEVKWRNDKRGWIRVSCNDTIVYFAENVETTDAPHCYITNVCEPDISKSPRRIYNLHGPVMAGFGHEWKKYGLQSPFTEFSGDIRVQMRNISLRKGATLYDDNAKSAVMELQQKLTALGCDPGPIDGLMGAKTRDAATNCRAFDDDQVPDAINAMTVGKWRDAYASLSD